MSKLLIVILMAAACLMAQPVQFQGGESLGAGERQIKPQAVPTSTTAVTTVDAYIRQITVANTSAGAINFTVADRQGTPIAFVPTVAIGPNTLYVVVIPKNYWAPGGFTVLASGSGLVYYASWRQ
jgi:hypothetical protein